MSVLVEHDATCVLCRSPAELACPCMQRYFCSIKCQLMDWENFQHGAVCLFDPASADSESEIIEQYEPTKLSTHTIEKVNGYTSSKHLTREQKKTDSINANPSESHDVGITVLSPSSHPLEDIDLSVRGALKHAALHRNGTPNVEYIKRISTNDADGYQKRVKLDDAEPTNSPNSSEEMIHVHTNGTAEVCTRTARDEHFRSSRDKLPLRCTWAGCPASFPTDSGLIAHSITHKDKEWGSRLHMNGSVDIKPYIDKQLRTDYDGSEYSNGRRQTDLQNTSSHEKQYECTWEGCDKRYLKQVGLNYHLKTHTGEKYVSCDWNGCDKQFINESCLNQHLKAHTGERKYICKHEGCEKRYVYQKDLTIHLRKHGGSNVFVCSYEDCDAKFVDQKSHAIHIKAHTNRTYKCPWIGCEKRFVEEIRLSQHVKFHTGTGPFMCTWENCHKRYVYESGLEHHMLTHTRKRPFICTWEGCSKRFTEKKSLDSHRMLHTGEKPFACTYPGCYMRCIDQRRLKQHMKSHTGERNYVCTWQDCDKRYSQKGDLDYHLKTHTGERPFACSKKDCDKRFIKLGHLNQHLKTHKN